MFFNARATFALPDARVALSLSTAGVKVEQWFRISPGYVPNNKHLRKVFEFEKHFTR